MSRTTVRFQRMPENKDLPLPSRETSGSAGLDLRACLSEGRTVAPGGRDLVPTGFRVAIPPGFEGQVRPRSGLAVKHGVTLLNAPGTIDSDYRGEVKVVLVNHGPDPFTIQHADRIAQLVVAPIEPVATVESDELPDTARGEGGFGHTGT